MFKGTQFLFYLLGILEPLVVQDFENLTKP